jgi:hypothetical protein
MTYPTPCSYAGCTRPAVVALPWNSNLSFCAECLARFHGQAAPAPAPPAEAPPAPPKQVRMFEQPVYTLPMYRRPGRRGH